MLLHQEKELELVGEREEPFVWIRESLLSDKRFTLGEKLFIARISGFKTYVESSEHCAEFLGIGVASVQRAKAKLVDLGALEEVSFDGKKKVFAVRLERLEQDARDSSESSDLSKRESRPIKMIEQTYQNDRHIIKNKEKVKEKTLNIDSKESILAQEPSGDDEEVDSTKCEEQSEFGNAGINEALEQWCEATGYDLKSNKYERRAMFNLLRRKDINALGGLKALLKLVKEASGIDSQFAPRIVKPSELGGKYSKLERLLEWSKRKDGDSRSETTPKQKKFEHKCSEQELAYISSYYRPHPYCKEEPESKPMTAEEEAEWKKARHEETLRARAIFEKRMQEKADAKKGEQ